MQLAFRTISSLLKLALIAIVIFTIFIGKTNASSKANLRDSLINALGGLNSSKSINKSLDLFLLTQSNPALISKYGTQNYSEILRKTSDWVNLKGNLSQQLRCKFYKCHYPIQLNDIEMIRQLTKLGSYDEFRRLKEYAVSLFILKFLYYRTEQFNEILEILPNLYAENKKHNNFLYISGGENYDMARIFYEIKNYPEAIKLFNKYYDQNADNNLIFKASIKNDIGLSYYFDSKIDSANTYFQKSILLINSYTILKKNKKENLSYINYFKNVVNSNKAVIWIDEGRFNLAMPYLKKEIRGGILFKENHIIISGYYHVADIMYFMNKPDIALTYLDSAFEVMKQYSYKNYYRKALNLKAKCYLLKGNMVKANLYFLSLQKFNDSLDKEKVKYTYATATAKYQSKIKEQELRDIKQKIFWEKSNNRSQRIVLISTFIVILLLVLYVLNLKRNKKRIAKKNNLIQNSLIEKEILLKEVHHRVKNNLQVISGLIQLNASKIKIPEIKEMLIESERYIESMSMVHQMLYQNENLHIISMEQYIDQLCSKILESAQIQYTLDINQIDLKPDYAIPIGLMITEMITNSIKHAFVNKSGNIHISLIELKKENYLFSYHDDGKGLPNILESRGEKTLGLKLISMLAEEMNGKMTIENKNGFYLQIVFQTTIKK